MQKIGLRWRIVIWFLKIVRRILRSILEWTERIVPAICQDCFDVEPDCKTCGTHRVYVAWDRRDPQMNNRFSDDLILDYDVDFTHLEHRTRGTKVCFGIAKYCNVRHLDRKIK